LKAIESQEHCGIVHRTSRVTSDDEARCLECGLSRAADRVLRLFYFGSDDGGTSRIRPEDSGPLSSVEARAFQRAGTFTAPNKLCTARDVVPAVHEFHSEALVAWDAYRLSIGSELIGVETARLRSRSAGFVGGGVAIATA
jgi:hypothetical protein